eukprot:NODE_5_length_72347_cov_1.339331.p28 type:complete len:300 gc:universal NODE_5_length_72347_cov_1.339331:5249-4350(-)
MSDTQSKLISEEKTVEIEYEEEVESVKNNLELLSDNDSIQQSDLTNSPEFKHFKQQSQFLQEVNESLVEAPHFLFDKFMTALNLQQENYRGLINKLDFLEDQQRKQNYSELLGKYNDLERRVAHLEADLKYFHTEAQSNSNTNTNDLQVAISKLEDICANTVIGVTDVMQYIKSRNQSEANINGNLSDRSASKFQKRADDMPSHKSDIFSDYQSDSASGKHNVATDWSIKTPTKSKVPSSTTSMHSTQRAQLNNLLDKYTKERRTLEDSAGTNRIHKKNSQLNALDKHIADLRHELENL